MVMLPFALSESPSGGFDGRRVAQKNLLVSGPEEMETFEEKHIVSKQSRGASRWSILWTGGSPGEVWLTMTLLSGSPRDFWSGLGCDCWNTELTCSVHTGGCAHEQECPVPAMSHSAEGSTSEKNRSQCFNMVVWIWKHPKHQVISEMMVLMGKDLSCSVQTKEHLWTSVGLWVLHRKTEMKNRALLQIHIMLSFHLSPWEHKGVYTVLSGVCDPVNNNSWTCWGWCQLLDRLLWQLESLLSKWSCAPCGWRAAG